MRLCSPSHPFPGLRPFEPGETHWFRGREREIKRLTDMVREKRLVAVLGSSGAGKSSLVLAGVLPRLLTGRGDENGTRWETVRLRPGGTPLRTLAAAMADLRCKVE